MLQKKHYRWMVELALILLVIVAARLWMQRGVVSGVAPDISAVMLDGQYFDFHKSKTRPMLIDFWATWCPVCKLEQSNIENISRDYAVMTIAMQSGDRQELKNFMLKENLSFNVINDEGGVLSKRYHIRGVPVSFVINKNNSIEFVEVGYTSELGMRARLLWAGL